MTLNKSSPVFKRALAAGVSCAPMCVLLAKDLGVTSTQWVGDPLVSQVQPPNLVSDPDVWVAQAKQRQCFPVAYAELPTVFRGAWHLTWQVNPAGVLSLWRERGDHLSRLLDACGASVGNKRDFKPEVFGMAIPLSALLIEEALEDFGAVKTEGILGGNGWRMKDRLNIHVFDDRQNHLTYIVEEN